MAKYFGIDGLRTVYFIGTFITDKRGLLCVEL